MKILMVHNEYGIYTGEEAAVDGLGDLFSANGHEVIPFKKSTRGRRDGLSNKLNAFFSGIYCHQGMNELEKVLKKDKPDLIHINNLYPFISPPALFVCHQAEVPIVMNVHNYRLICPTGLMMRDNKPCEDCLNKGEWGCIKHNCEHDLPKSIAHALRNYTSRKTGAYLKNIDRFVCLTSFQRDKLIGGGFVADRIAVIPNFVNAVSTDLPRIGNYIAYVGRLSHEKGWDLLIDIAKLNPDLLIHVAGNINQMESSAHMPSNIVFKGFLNKAELGLFYESARFVVIPSRCYEGLPMVLLEALAAGKPVVAPGHGGFAEIIKTGKNASGRLFMPGDIGDLEHKIRELWNNEELIRDLSHNAVNTYKSTYSAPVIYQQWQQLFSSLEEHDYKYMDYE